MDQKKIRLYSIIAGVIISIVAIVVVLGVFGGVFTRAEDAAPRDVVVADITNNAAKVTWATGNDNQGVIEYGTSPTALNFFAPETTSTKAHSIDLTLLSPNTTYYFQIRIGDKKYDNGGVPWSFATKSVDGAAVNNNATLAPTKAAAPIVPTNTVAAVKATPTPISSLQIPAGGTANTASITGCVETSCDRIKAQIGKTCTAADYLKCLKATPTTTR